MFTLKTLKSKLLAMSIASTATALFAACGTLAVYDYHQFVQGMANDAQTNAEMVAGNATAALSFSDVNDATQTLATLRVEPHVVAAALYDRRAKRFATYFRGAAVPIPNSVEEFPKDGLRFGSDSLDVFVPVRLNGQVIGTVYLQEDTALLRQRADSYLTVFGTVMLGAMVVALFLSNRLGRYVLGPIQHLSRTALSISSNRNYAVRAEKTSADELGALVDCFNAMLDQIQQRDQELIVHKDHLEDLVEGRTAELTKAKVRAEEASRAKTAFLANMSHEIRTPMTAILGYADLMLSPVQTMSDRINCLQVVRRNARHLMDLINDILDISKIEAEKMTVEKIPCDVARIVADVTSTLRARAVAKHVSLNAEFVGPIPAAIQTDPLRLKQVLMNLVGNAIKFTHRGEVSLKVSVEPEDKSCVAQFRVIDSGIGIAADQIERLFQPFVQADESMTRKYGGTGLGLVISKRLAKYLGGDLTVKSAQGVGSTFTLTLNGGSIEGVEMLDNITESMLGVGTVPPDAEEITLRGRILLAEDGIDNQQLLTMHLTMAGAEVVVANNGRIAMELAQAQHFEVILMDMQMPEMDGYTATRELRRLGHQLPIIALTAHAMSGDRAKCLEAGCTDYLTKPIDKELLLRTIRGYIPHAVIAQVNAPLAKVPEPKPASPADTAAQAMKQAVTGFVGRLPARVDALLERLAAGDVAELARLTHQLKGVGGGYGFPTLTTSAGNAEAVLKASNDMERIRVAVDELVALMRGINGYEQGKETRVQRQTSNH